MWLLPMSFQPEQQSVLCIWANEIVSLPVAKTELIRLVCIHRIGSEQTMIYVPVLSII